MGTNQQEDEGSQDLTSYPTILSIQMLMELGSQVPYPERQYDVGLCIPKSLFVFSFLKEMTKKHEYYLRISLIDLRRALC